MTTAPPDLGPQLPIPSVSSADRKSLNRHSLFKLDDLKTPAERDDRWKKGMDEDDDLQGVVDDDTDLESIGDDSDVSSTDCDELDDDKWLWEQVVMLDNTDDILDNLKGWIYLYMQKDEMFQKIMDDIKWAERKQFSTAESIEYSLTKNKDSIIKKVANCRQTGDDEFWCQLAARKRPPSCEWFTGDSCNCENCNGSNYILKTVRRFSGIFYGMQHDGLMQEIIKEVGEKMGEDVTFDAAAEKVLQRHKDDILEKYRGAKEILKVCGWEKE